MAISNLCVLVTVTCVITLFKNGNTHPVEPEKPIELEEFAKKVGVELLEIDSANSSRVERNRPDMKTNMKDEDHKFLCPSQGQVAIPHECKKYHVCARAGAESSPGICLGEKLFHHQRRACFRMSEPECHASMCKNISDRFHDPYSRENYLSCQEMIPQVQKCPEGKIFNLELRMCEVGSVLKGLKESFEEEVETMQSDRSTKKPKIQKNKTTGKPTPTKWPQVKREGKDPEPIQEDSEQNEETVDEFDDVNA